MPPSTAIGISAVSGQAGGTLLTTVGLYELTIESSTQGHSILYPHWNLEDTTRFVIYWVFFFCTVEKHHFQQTSGLALIPSM